MDNTMNIYQKLYHIQSTLKAPKSQYNKFGNYSYRNCEDIQEALKPIMKDIEVALVIGDELIQIGERYYIKATAKLIDISNGESVENTAYAREEQDKKGMDASQITGSTSSYARKYALNGLFCIDDTKDADNYQGNTKSESHKDSVSRNKNNNKNNKSFKNISENEVNVIFIELQRTGIGLKGMLSKYGLSDIHEMTIEQFNDAIGILKKKPDKPIDPRTIPPDNMDEKGLPWNTPDG